MRKDRDSIVIIRVPKDPKKYILGNKLLLEYYRKRGISKQDLCSLLDSIKFSYESLSYPAHFEVGKNSIAVDPQFASSKMAFDTILVHEVEHRLQSLTEPNGRYSTSEFGAYLSEMLLSKVLGKSETSAVGYQMKRFGVNFKKKERKEMRRTLRWLYRLCDYIEPHSIICHGYKEGLKFAKKELA